MADFTQIIQEINADINTNGVGAITGAKLNEVLRDMIAAVNAAKQDPLTIDATPTEGSTNPVQSGGVFTALDNLITNGCLFGGEVSPQEQIPHGNDHSYFYLAIKDGIYTNFSSNIELTNCIAIIFWDTNTQNWGFLDINYNVDYVDNRLNGKQDTISDLEDIRNGASAGATAFQKPSNGIPATDMDENVQAVLENAVLYSEQSIGITDQQRNTALANVSNQTANSTTGKMGYKVLDPTKTFAEQVTAENTIYEIRDVFDLGGTQETPVSVTIPEGSTLKFNGGMIKNCTINGNKASIESTATKIFGTSVVLDGEWNIDGIYVEWFGAGTSNDDTNAVEAALQSCFRIAKTLYINRTIFVFGNTQFGSTSPSYRALSIKGRGTIIWEPSGENDSLFYLNNNISSFEIRDIQILVNAIDKGIVFHLTSTAAANRGNKYINVSASGNSAEHTVNYVFYVEGTTHCDLARVDKCSFARFNHLYYSSNSEAVGWTFSQCSIGSARFNSVLFEFDKMNGVFNIVDSSFSVWSGSTILKTNPLTNGNTNREITFLNGRFEFYDTIGETTSNTPILCSLYWGKGVFINCDLVLTTAPIINFFAYAVGAFSFNGCTLPNIVLGAGMVEAGATISRDGWLPVAFDMQNSSFYTIQHKLLSDDGTVNDYTNNTSTNNFGSTIITDCYEYTTKERFNYEIISTNNGSKDYRREHSVAYNKAWISLPYKITLPPFQEIEKIEVLWPFSSKIDSVSIDFGGVTTITKNVSNHIDAGCVAVFDGMFFTSNQEKNYIIVSPTIGGATTVRLVEIIVHYRCVFFELLRNVPSNQVIVRDNKNYAQPIISGDTNSRPTNVDAGFVYLDTTLNKPIWSIGNNAWIDATGATV